MHRPDAPLELAGGLRDIVVLLRNIDLCGRSGARENAVVHGACLNAAHLRHPRFNGCALTASGPCLKRSVVCPGVPASFPRQHKMREKLKARDPQFKKWSDLNDRIEELKREQIHRLDDYLLRLPLFYATTDYSNGAAPTLKPHPAQTKETFHESVENPAQHRSTNYCL